jgi:hypothetical protein
LTKFSSYDAALDLHGILRRSVEQEECGEESGPSLNLGEQGWDSLG